VGGRGWRWCVCCRLASLLAACAFDVVHVTQRPAKLESAGPASASFLLEDDATVDLGTGFNRVLRKGTRWEPVGRIAEGDVYRTRDQVLTVEASHVYEAYVVVTSGKLVGFYLPVQRTFSPLPDPVPLAMKPPG
jgi:hypothetical protein